MSTSEVHTLMDMVKDFIPAVDTAYNNLLASKNFYKYVPKIKVNARATFLIEAGYKKMFDEDFRIALECFTQAIAFAENKSDKLSECYYERAKMLHIIEYEEKASEDIKRSSISDQKRFENLRKRFGKTILGGVAYSQPVRRLPQIPDYEMSETHPCSTTNIRIVNGETKGHRVIATSRLHISENIVVEKPLVIASGKHESILFCHECMLFCLNPIPCSSCSQVAFCGEVCKASAWKRYHKYECHIQYITDQRKQYRLAVKIALSFRDYINLQDDSHCPKGYKDILNRESSSEDISDEIKNDFALFAAQVFHGLKKYTTFFSNIKNPEKFNIFKGLFMKLMLVVNEHQREFIKRYRYFCRETSKIFRISCIGIYPFVSHFRTSCSPNATLDYCETSMVVKTLRIIEPGEEISIYGTYYFAVAPKEERQAIFQKKYSTVCKCEACENNWPLGADLERICNSSVTFSLHMLLRRVLQTRSLNIFLEHAHARAKDYVGVYVMRPSLEWLSWQCFLIKVHELLCYNCETVKDFLRRRRISPVSQTNRSSE